MLDFFFDCIGQSARPVPIYRVRIELEIKRAPEISVRAVSNRRILRANDTATQSAGNCNCGIVFIVPASSEQKRTCLAELNKKRKENYQRKRARGGQTSLDRQRCKPVGDRIELSDEQRHHRK